MLDWKVFDLAKIPASEILMALVVLQIEAIQFCWLRNKFLLFFH